MAPDKQNLNTECESMEMSFQFSHEVMVLHCFVFFLFTFGSFPESEHNELMLSGRMNV